MAVESGRTECWTVNGNTTNITHKYILLGIVRILLKTFFNPAALIPCCSENSSSCVNSLDDCKARTFFVSACWLSIRIKLVLEVYLKLMYKCT